MKLFNLTINFNKNTLITTNLKKFIKTIKNNIKKTIIQIIIKKIKKNYLQSSLILKYFVVFIMHISNQSRNFINIFDKTVCKSFSRTSILNK